MQPTLIPKAVLARPRASGAIKMKHSGISVARSEGEGRNEADKRNRVKEKRKGKGKRKGKRKRKCDL